MHKDDVACQLDMDLNTGNVLDMKVVSPELMSLYVDSKRAMSDWWSMRSIPISVKKASDRQFMRINGIATKEQFALKNLGLSMSDCYWVRPNGTDFKFKDINFFDNFFVKIDLNRDSSVKLSDGLTPLATTTGQMRKYWHIKGGKRMLFKSSEDRLEGRLQCLNEVFGWEFHKRIGKHAAVKYSLSTNANGDIKGVSCAAFTSADLEYVPMLNMVKESELISLRGSKLKGVLIDSCVSAGLKKSDVADFFSYLAVSDFIMSNKDRHLNNFGLLRDSNTMRYVGFAPVFDSGNSMLYDNIYSVDDPKFKLLKTEISGIYDTDRKLLASLKRCNSDIDLTVLPSSDYVYDFYRSKLNIDDGRIAENISKAYAFKIETIVRNCPDVFMR